MIVSMDTIVEELLRDNVAEDGRKRFPLNPALSLSRMKMNVRVLSKKQWGRADFPDNTVLGFIAHSTPQPDGSVYSAVLQKTRDKDYWRALLFSALALAASGRVSAGSVVSFSNADIFYPKTELHALAKGVRVRAMTPVGDVSGSWASALSLKQMSNKFGVSESEMVSRLLALHLAP